MKRNGLILVYAKIKDQLKSEDWSLDEEEFEDADGNVLSKKMYNDLVRQGLILTVCKKQKNNAHHWRLAFMTSRSCHVE